MYFVATSNPPLPNSFNTDAPRQASPAPLPSPPALFHHFSQQQQQQQQQHQQLSMHQMQQPSFIGHAPALYSTQQQPQLQHRVAPQHQPMALPQQQLPPHQLFELVGQSQTGGAPMYILSSPQPQPQQDPRLQPTGLPSGGGAVAPPPSSVCDPAPCEHNNWDNLRAKHSVVTLCCRDCQRKWKQQFPIRNLCPEFHTRLHCTFGTNCPFLHVHRFKSFQKSPDPPGHIVGSVRDRLFAQIALRVLLENPGKEPRDVAGEVHERHRAMLSRGESIVVTSTSDMNSFSSGTNLANFGGQSMVSLTSAPSMTSTDVMRRDPWNGEDSVADLALTATGAPLLVEIPKPPVPLHHHHQQFHMQQHTLSPNTKLVQQQQPMLQSVQQLHPNQPMHFSAAHQHHQQPINMTPSSWQPSTQLPGSSAPRGAEIVYFAQQSNGGPTSTTPSTSHQPQQGMFAPLPPYLPSHTAPFPTFSPFTGVGGEGHHLQGHHHGQLAPPPGMHVAPTASSTVPYVQPAPPHHLHQVPPSLHPMNVPYGGQMVLVMPSTPPHSLQGGSNGDWSSIMNAQRQ